MTEIFVIFVVAGTLITLCVGIYLYKNYKKHKKNNIVNLRENYNKI